jgi:hypothetical protein
LGAIAKVLNAVHDRVFAEIWSDHIVSLATQANTMIKRREDIFALHLTLHPCLFGVKCFNWQLVRVERLQEPRISGSLFVLIEGTVLGI